VVHLIPPFARRRLYTYPTPSTDPKAAGRDCHWTSLNFFSVDPNDDFTVTEAAVRAFERDYYTIQSEFRLGDIILFTEGPTNKCFHSAVYIADDILFTKNGPRASNPWMLMRLEHMRDYYLGRSPVKLRYLRHR